MQTSDPHEQEKPSPPYLTRLSFENFRLFKSGSITNITATHLIMGMNGSGKSTIFWAIVLVLRAYNSRLRASQHASSARLEIFARELAALLNFSALESISLSQLIRKDVESRSCLISGQIGEEDLKCNITATGVMNLQPTPLTSPDTGKIRFAFVAPDVHWCPPNDEPEATEYQQLCSSRPCYRGRYRALKDSSKEELGAIMDHLFKIKFIKEQYGELLVEQHGHVVEIMHTGAALRKVFVVLTLLFTLRETEEPRRIYLIEEPEAQLYPVLQRELMGILVEKCKKHAIQLFVTSNSDCVRQHFRPKDIFVVLGEQGGHHVGRRKWLDEAVRENLLGLSKKPLLLCEGPHDPLFISTIAKHFGISTEGVQLRETAGRCASSDIQELVTEIVQQEQPKAYVRFLHNPDFRLDATAGLNPKTNEFFWDLPSIESYLFLYHCEKHKKEKKPGSPLEFLRDLGHQAAFAKDYANCFRSQNRDPASVVQMFRNWTHALRAAESPDPSTSDFIAVASVLRGHTWAERIRESTTTVIIGTVESDIKDLCPRLGQLLQQLVQFSEAASAGAKDKKEKDKGIQSDA